MDIVTAMRLLTKTFEIGPEGTGQPPGLDAHGLIGDGLTCALVRVDGAIDWLCFPRFDSPSVFGAALDEEDGGRLQVAPKQRPFTSRQKYEPETNVLETLFEVPGQGAVRITDFMPWMDDDRASYHEVHRRIEGVSGTVPLEIIFDPRFDYARTRPNIERSPHGAVARHGRDTLCLALREDVASTIEERKQGGVKFETSVRPGEHHWVIASWGGPTVAPLPRYRAWELLRATRKSWRHWIANGFSYEGPWRHHVMRSALVLKLLQYAPTGAMVAAPTTSLPEWLGGERNWDYRYAWTRDSAMSVRSMNRIGYGPEAQQFFHFVRDVLDATPHVPVMTTIDGAPVPEEEILEHLAGHLDSRPVRIGNGAKSQTQLDCSGYLLDAAHVYEHTGGSLTLRVWRHLVEAVDETCRRWSDPDHGIWEPRRPPRHNVHTKLMAWVTLDRALDIAPLFGGIAQEATWRTTRDAIQDAIRSEGTTADGKYYRPILGDGHDEDVDAALLVMNRYGFTERGDPRNLATIRHIRDVLTENGFMNRYMSNDGVPGHEGAFVLCGFWLAEALALEGAIDEALDVFNRHIDATNHLGLLAEEVDANTLQGLGNFPQAFSHLGLIDAAYILNRSLEH
ncbi:MAG: glycoside hydrolase family 15 protein [Deltaproteobacteria bacterium]